MRFNVQFSQTNQKIPIQFNASNKHFEMGFQAFQPLTERPSLDYYEGSYDVIPKVTAQTLETKEKFLADNIKVHEIPYFDVSNTSGGTTIYIGKEVEIYGN